MQSKPWYKQFWPWFLIAVPTSSVIVAGIVVQLATNTTDSLVVDDYYKEGRTINLRLDKFKVAKEMGIKSQLLVNDSSISLQFEQGAPQNGEALKLSFQHTTLKERDFSILLTRDANGVYRGSTDSDTSGKWRVSLLPMNEEWKVQHIVALPRTAPIVFNADE
ncbi:FixH family protein [Aestuariibacter salexigens]|uniref:FixH family protein n=1 Tax=Aestuariibacter salexigens TaxID=226010 RepID=UPI00041EDF10|nr:FixH family protein [Aestuariibacter salexigens]